MSSFVLRLGVLCLMGRFDPQGSKLIKSIQWCNYGGNCGRVDMLLSYFLPFSFTYGGFGGGSNDSTNCITMSSNLRGHRGFPISYRQTHLDLKVELDGDRG